MGKMPESEARAMLGLVPVFLVIFSIGLLFGLLINCLLSWGGMWAAQVLFWPDLEVTWAKIFAGAVLLTVVQSCFGAARGMVSNK